MRRAVPVLAATAGGIALLAGFKTSPQAPAVRAGGTTPSTTAADAPTTSSSAPVVTPGSAPTTVAPPRTTVPPTTAAPQRQRSIDGPDVTMRFGDVQVRILVTGHHLDDVQALTMPQDRERSAEISDYAEPRLRREALQAQSANIDIVSGATYTSDAYAQSLQGAIDAIR